MFTQRLDDLLGAVKAAEPFRANNRSTQRAVIADARNLEAVSELNMVRRPDVIVTSPPYASALPYIDTQRLSLVALGLLEPSALRGTERDLIGARELTSKKRLELEDALRANTAGLPESSLSCVNSLLALAERPGNGFRKKNVPALMYRYFSDMQSTFRSLASFSAEDCRMGLVIGPNRTSVGDCDTTIDTPTLLADIAGKSGWLVDDVIRLDAFHRFDLHSTNSIREEALLLLSRDVGFD